MNINYIKKNIFTLVLIIFVSFLPVISFAQNGNNPPPGGNGNNPPPVIDTNDSENVTIINPIASTSLVDLIKTILVGAMKIGIPIIALAIIYSGFLFVAARGNSEKIGKAKDALLYTLIGAAILLGAWAIALLIKDTVLAL